MITKIESDEKVLSIEETKKAQDQYLDSLKAKCKLQILFGDDPFETYVVIDGEVIGFIQKLFVEVDSEDQLNRTVEIAFPKIGFKSGSLVKEHAQKLASLGFVNVVYKNLDWSKVEKESSNVGQQVAKNDLRNKQADFVSSDEDFEKSLKMVKSNKMEA